MASTKKSTVPQITMKKSIGRCFFKRHTGALAPLPHFLYSATFPNEILKTLHFYQPWLFLKKWNNESVSNIVINITPTHLFLTSTIEVYPATDVRKNCHHKMLTNFYIKSPISSLIVMGGGRNHVYNQITFIFNKE